METDYKGYTIEVLTELVPRLPQWWTFRALVFVPDGTVNRFNYHGPHFQTKDEAEREGLRLVKQWIDDGMPDLR